MKRAELAQKLRDERVDPAFYSLIGGFPNDAFCLDETGGRWTVYYSERGNAYDAKEFHSEEEACDYLYNWLTSTLARMGLR